jgi:hypothetical protein
MAVITLKQSDEAMYVDSFWAGDSHCYLWNKEGFFQISEDDLEENNDPMENLHNDSPISNCVCADRDFVIHHKSISLTIEPVIILCATDGCFGYFKTPMHFENVLRSCLQETKNEKEWRDKIKETISEVTGDDCSLSLIAVGYDSFDGLKKSMKASTIIDFQKILKLEQDIACAEQMLADTRVLYEQSVSDGWDNYKNNFMKYINDKDNADA